jgi:hypothetical protein
LEDRAAPGGGFGAVIVGPGFYWLYEAFFGFAAVSGEVGSAEQSGPPVAPISQEQKSKRGRS